LHDGGRRERFGCRDAGLVDGQDAGGDEYDATEIAARIVLFRFSGSTPAFITVTPIVRAIGVRTHTTVAPEAIRR
jgi:hypothetical protein